MPIPPAAFSPLTTTKSGASSSRSPGSSSRSARRPARPTTSPMKRMAVIAGSYRRRMAQHTDQEAANPLADVGEPAPEDAQPSRAATPAPPARVEPVLVPRWVQLVLLPLAIVGAYLLLKAAGSVLLLFIIAGLIALLLNPLVALLRAPARIPRGAAVAIVMIALVALPGRPRVRARRPDLRPGVELPARGPGLRRRRQRARSPTCRTGSTAAAGTSRSSARGRPRCRRSASASPAAPARSSASPATPCSGSSRRASRWS